MCRKKEPKAIFSEILKLLFVCILTEPYDFQGCGAAVCRVCSAASDTQNVATPVYVVPPKFLVKKISA